MQISGTNLRKDMFRQIRALEESDSLSSTNMTISIQICPPEIRIEQILASRRPWRCHFSQKDDPKSSSEDSVQKFSEHDPNHRIQRCVRKTLIHKATNGAQSGRSVGERAPHRFQD